MAQKKTAPTTNKLGINRCGIKVLGTMILHLYTENNSKIYQLVYFFCIFVKKTLKMKSKAEITREFIIKTTAPIFNKNGYSGTSMSDISKATGLTKGAIYGNFKNKEALALEAFNFNVRFIINKLRDIIFTVKSPVARLYALTNFYRNYTKHAFNFGGCPILNVGVDANHTNPILYERVKHVAIKMQKSIENIIQDGIDCGEMKENLDAEAYGGRIFALIEGAVFSSVLLHDDKYLLDMMNHLDHIIKTEIAL